MNKKLLITANHKMEKKLVGYFERELGLPADMFFVDSSGKKNENSLFRHVSYFMIALKAFSFRNNYQYIIFWEQFVGLYYGLISRMFFFVNSKPKTIILTLIFINRQGCLGNIYRSIFRFMLKSKSITNAVCHSKSEIRYYNSVLRINNDKVVFAEVGEGEPGEINQPNHENIYFFSGGGSQRDYKTLIEAFKGLEYKLKIACLPSHVKNIKIPPNVKVYYNKWHRDFDKMIVDSYAVILTLEDPKISSGQLVLLKAMRMGKPVIVTAGECLKDYTDDSFAISVKHHSPPQIIKAVNVIANNEKKWVTMSQNAFELYKVKYSRCKYVKRVCDIIK